MDEHYFKHSLSYGGELRKKRKGRGARPLSSKEPIHLVLKGTLAQKQWSFRLPRNHQIVHALIYKFSKLYGIRIDQKAVHFDHIHFVLRVPNRTLYKRFIRRLSGAIAVLVTDGGPVGAGRVAGGKKSLKDRGFKFFKHRPFSRVIRGWRAYQQALAYVKLNEQEAMGNIPVRDRRLKDLEPHEYCWVWS